MAYTLKSKTELQKELYLELKDFVTNIVAESRYISEDNYFDIANMVLIEAARIEHYWEVIRFIPEN